MTQEQTSPAVELVRHLIAPMLRESDTMTLQLRDERQGPTVRVTVAANDIGRVIGRQGRTIQAIRTLVSTLGEHATRVEIDEAQG